MRSVAVLGAGFIGKNLIEACLAQQFVVRVLDRKSCPADLCGKVTWIQGTFDSVANVSDTVRGVDVVFHLISNTVPGDVIDVSKELFDNVSQTIQLLDLCVAENVGRIVFVSSSSVYGPKLVTPIGETALPNPISAHGIQKLTLEYYLRLYKYERGLDCKIMRLSNPYGMGQDVNGRQGFISILMGNLLASRVTRIRGDGRIVRDFININDVANACLLLATTSSDRITFNIGSGEGVTLNDVIANVESILGHSMSVEYIDSRRADIPVSVLDIRKAMDHLGFRPLIPLRDGLSQYLSLNGIL